MNLPDGAFYERSNPINDRDTVVHYTEIPKCPIHDDEMEETQWGFECKHWEDGCQEGVTVNEY